VYMVDLVGSGLLVALGGGGVLGLVDLRYS
jgi:hypothetical protein